MLFRPSRHVKYDKSSLPEPSRHVKYDKLSLPEPSRHVKYDTTTTKIIIINNAHDKNDKSNDASLLSP